MSLLASPIELTYFTTPAGHDIGLTLWLPPKAAGALPLIVSIHGGGLTNGARNDLYFNKRQAAITEGFLEAGYAVISPDYRLLGPSTSHDQLDDIDALIKYLSSSFLASALPQGTTLDLTRVGLIGYSAGGYMVIQMAIRWLRTKPEGLKIKGVVPYYPMGGGLLSDYYVLPGPILEGLPPVPYDTITPFLLPTETSSAPVTVYPPAPISRSLVFRYLLQNHILLDWMSGHPGLTASLAALPFPSRAAAVPDTIKPLFPEIFLASEDPLAKELPPMMIVHGDADALIELKESLAMEESLKMLGADYELVVVKGAGHGLIKPGPELAFVEEAEEVDKGAVRYLVERV